MPSETVAAYIVDLAIAAQSDPTRTPPIVAIAVHCADRRCLLPEACLAPLCVAQLRVTLQVTLSVASRGIIIVSSLLYYQH